MDQKMVSKIAADLISTHNRVPSKLSDQEYVDNVIKSCMDNWKDFTSEIGNKVLGGKTKREESYLAAYHNGSSAEKRQFTMALRKEIISQIDAKKAQ